VNDEQPGSQSRGEAPDGSPPPAPVRSPWAAACYLIREFFGENDYARYVADWKARHAEGKCGTAGGAEIGDDHHMMTEREFFEERLRIKYGGNVQRCC
jgi:uncharacterized short protein YbdD (DUF466 family)